MHGYAYPDATDASDGNWLRVMAHAGALGAAVWTTGVILDTMSVQRFRRELAELHEGLSGEATLESDEPNVMVRVTSLGQGGQLEVRAELTPNHLAQGHWFDFAADQSYLPGVIAQCDAVLARFPVRDDIGGGV